MQVQGTEWLLKTKEVDQNHRTAGDNSVTCVTLKSRQGKRFPYTLKSAPTTILSSHITGVGVFLCKQKQSAEAL